MRPTILPSSYGLNSTYLRQGWRSKPIIRLSDSSHLKSQRQSALRRLHQLMSFETDGSKIKRRNNCENCSPFYHSIEPFVKSSVLLILRRSSMRLGRFLKDGGDRLRMTGSVMQLSVVFHD